MDRVNGIAGVFLVDDLNTRVVDDIQDIRTMVNAIAASGPVRRVTLVLPPNPTAVKLQADAARPRGDDTAQVTHGARQSTITATTKATARAAQRSPAAR